MNGMIQPIPDITTETYKQNPALALYKVAKQLEENQRVICTRITLKNEEQDREIESIKVDQKDKIEDLKDLIKDNNDLIVKNKKVIDDVKGKVDVSEGIKEETRKEKALKLARGAYRVTQFGVFLGFCYFLVDKFVITP